MTRSSAARVVSVALLTAAVAAALAVPIAGAQPTAEPLPRIAFLARADDPVDALAVSDAAGVLGAPVLLTHSDALAPAAAEALTASPPDLVVLAGGLHALGPEVADAVEALGLPVRRIAGDDRTTTAAALAAFLVELGAGRPVVTGAPVTDQVVPGLNAALLDGRTAEELRGEPGPAGPAGPAGDPDRWDR